MLRLVALNACLHIQQSVSSKVTSGLLMKEKGLYMSVSYLENTTFSFGITIVGRFSC